MAHRGTFILVEGVDRAGKTTQCAKLVEHLGNQKMDVVHIQFPDRQTHTGQIIDKYLKTSLQVDDHVIHLLFSANRWEVASKIRDIIQSGTSIVMDRYAYSGVAYSHAKGLPLDWCISPDRTLPAPDVVIFLEVSMEAQKKRGEWGNECYEKTEFQAKVAKTYDCLEDSTWSRVNGDRSFEEVHKDICEIAVEEVRQEHKSQLGNLWESNIMAT